MERLSLRDAAEKTARSVTTLRRYIRSGRLLAEKLPGRFGPEYFVTAEGLEASGCGRSAAPIDSPVTKLATRTTASMPLSSASLDRVLRESVPISLFQDLQLKHEQLLVQYGMVRAGGLRIMELQAELESRRRQVDDAQAENTRVKERLALEAGDLRKRLREAELELEGRRLESGALRDKIRALEMLTRNRVTNEAIERQFTDVMDQMRRVDRLTAEQDVKEPGSLRSWPARGPFPDPDH